jgi:hypothetical protein
MASIDQNTAQLLGALGAAVSLFSVIPYGLAIWRRAIRPHLFTWLIWSVVTIIAAAAQFAAGAGPSAWCTAAVALTCFLTFVASIFRGEKGWTRSDWFFLAAAFSTIPIWILTDDPTISVCLVTLIELAGLAPTVRKTVRDPWSENLLYFALCVLKYTLALLALQTWNLAVAIYPAVNVVVTACVCMLIVVRRQALTKTAATSGS